MDDRTVIGRSAEDEGANQQGAGAQLVVVEGVCRGLVCDLGDAECGIGRKHDNGLVLASARVSKHHARVRRDGPRYHLEDLGSTNGTAVNGVALPPEQCRPLYHGDSIALGDHLILFRQVGSFVDDKTGMSTISFDSERVRAEVEDLLKGLPIRPDRSGAER